jgi:hypothetical protein
MYFDVRYGRCQNNRLTGKGNSMAKKPNYGYEKRQKELAKKAKKAEKSKRRQEEKSQEAPEDTSEDV